MTNFYKIWYEYSDIKTGHTKWTFSATCLHVQRRERPLAAEGGTLRGREMFRQIWPRIRIPRNSRDLLHAANLRHGTDGFTSPRKEGVLRNFSPLKIRRLRPGSNPRLNLGTKGQHATSRPPKPFLVKIYHPFATRVSQLKIGDFSEETLKVFKCYNFLWGQRRHNCSPAASFANCVMTLYLLKVHLQTFLSIPINQKCQILSCETLVTNKRCMNCVWNSILYVDMARSV
jgi:hypothetical protein